jgi:DNA-binding MarR family transcriptional regulator
MISSQPKHTTECVCHAVRRTARSLTNAYDKALAPSGIRTTQYSMLCAISRNSVASVGDLSEWLALDQTTATRNLLTLEESGLIERVAHHDPRVKLLKLTAKGKQKLQKAHSCWGKVQKQVLSGLSEKEWTQLRGALRKIDSISLSL